MYNSIIVASIETVNRSDDENKRSSIRRSQALKVGAKIMNFKLARPQGEPSQINRAIRIQDSFLQDGLSFLSSAEDNNATAVIQKAERILRLAETQEDAAWWINGGMGRSFAVEYRAANYKP